MFKKMLALIFVICLCQESYAGFSLNNKEREALGLKKESEEQFLAKREIQARIYSIDNLWRNGYEISKKFNFSNGEKYKSIIQHIYRYENDFFLIIEIIKNSTGKIFEKVPEYDIEHKLTSLAEIRKVIIKKWNETTGTDSILCYVYTGLFQRKEVIILE